jgi:hypothetical protein
MQITFDNTQNASLLSWNLTVLQNSRPLTWHDGKTVAMPAVNGWIAANFDPQANIVATSNPSLAAGAQQTRLMPLYHGYVMAFNNPAGNIAESITFVQSDFNAAALNTYWQFQVNAFGIQLVYMPRAQSSAIIKNNGAATQSCGLAVIGVEY